MYDVRSHRLLKPKEWDRYLFFNPCHVGSILENEKIYLYFLSFFIAGIARVLKFRLTKDSFTMHGQCHGC